MPLTQLRTTEGTEARQTPKGYWQSPTTLPCQELNTTRESECYGRTGGHRQRANMMGGLMFVGPSVARSECLLGC